MLNDIKKKLERYKNNPYNQSGSSVELMELLTDIINYLELLHKPNNGPYREIKILPDDGPYPKIDENILF